MASVAIKVQTAGAHVRAATGSKRLLECLQCKQRYSEQDVAAGAYRLETMVCSYCYAQMQRAPYAVSCFGKPMQVLPSGKREHGWNPGAEECRRLCPDREVCRLVMIGQRELV